MKLAISPKHTADDFEGGMTLDQKIEVFTEAVRGWHLGVAKEMADKDVSHRGFAQLHIVTSYFEMIAKYREGFVGERESRKHFEKGVRAVFPVIDTWPQDIANGLLELLYKNVRSGLYHMGMIKTNVILTGDLPFPMQYDNTNGVVYINPDKLVEALQAHFEVYARDLRELQSTVLRSNFEKRFNLDRGIVQP